jgi:hypothetical protein
MSLIQIGLVLGVFSLMFLYLVYLRSMLRDRVIALVIFAGAVAAILFPQLTSLAANFLGVGRGTDLLLYILTLAFFFAVIMLSTRILKLQDNLTELTRQIALSNARAPEGSKGSNLQEKP